MPSGIEYVVSCVVLPVSPSNFYKFIKFLQFLQVVSNFSNALSSVSLHDWDVESGKCIVTCSAGCQSHGFKTRTWGQQWNVLIGSFKLLRMISENAFWIRLPSSIEYVPLKKKSSIEYVVSCIVLTVSPSNFYKFTKFLQLSGIKFLQFVQVASK